jgi:hypothetical protein
MERLLEQVVQHTYFIYDAAHLDSAHLDSVIFTLPNGRKRRKMEWVYVLHKLLQPEAFWVILSP